MLFLLTLYTFLTTYRDMKFGGKSTLSALQSIEYAISLANAIKSLHAKNVPHRDIKSANIMVPFRALEYY